MARLRRKETSSFNLSFLDIMFCGFGAVVLLVLILSRNVSTIRQTQVDEIAVQVLTQQAALQLAQDTLEQRQADKKAQEQRRSELQAQQKQLRDKLSSLETSAPAPETADELSRKITALTSELRELEKNRHTLRAAQPVEPRAGRHARTFIGEGQRQYLTGLRLGGKRTLILLDSSASMLDRRIVDIVRLKVRDETVRRQSPKWRRSLRTIEWLLANLPPDSAIKLCSFNTAATFPGNPENRWIPLAETETIDAMIEILYELAPTGGTDLEKPFQLSRTMTPAPDNIILLTDGLPTTSERTASAQTIDGRGRAKLFERAIKRLPGTIPLNIILFPVEGDPMAAVLFWKLAIDTGGSFMTPTQDWP